MSLKEMADIDDMLATDLEAQEVLIRDDKWPAWWIFCSANHRLSGSAVVE